MNRVSRVLAPLALAVFSLVAAAAGTVTITPVTQWTKTDVPPDPSITFGTLPNGMRYLIKANAQPEQAVSVYLRVAAGSFDESPKEAGLAHFIEHMAFRGTAHIPDGELDKRLQSIGVGLGSDSNAQTQPAATIYTFDFPKNDKTTLDTAFTLTRDIADGLLFEPAAVETEKKVVLAEFRLRDTPGLRLHKAHQTALFGEPLAQASMAIGRTEVISAATPEALRAFYRAHYRPERLTLIVVGAVDVKAVEAGIKARFGDVKAMAPARPLPRYTTADAPKEPQFKSYIEEGAGSVVQMSWVKPYDPTPETKARDRRDTVREIAFAVLNQRLRELATSSNPPFLNASGGAHNSYQTAFLTTLGAVVGNGDPAVAVRALAKALKAITVRGASQSETDRAVAQQRMAIATTVTAAPSRKTAQLARNYASQAGSVDVIDGPENWQPTFEDAVKDLSADDVTKVLKELFSGAPLVFVSAPKPVSGGDAAIAAAYAEGLAAPVAEAGNVAVIWPYTDFGPEGRVATEKKLDDLGVTFLTFANGVRATLKPTKFQEGQIELSVRIGQGRSGFDKTKPNAGWAIPGAWGSGGLAKISNGDLPKALSGKQWGISPSLSDSGFYLNGRTRPADLLTELQLAAALVTDPGWRPEGLEQTKSATITSLEQAATTAPSLFGLHNWSFLHAFDPRWTAPAIDQVKATGMDAVKALVMPALKDGPIEVVLAGDFDPAEAVAALKKTFGALAPRRVETSPPEAHESLPKTGPEPFVVRYKGQSQDATAALNWPTTGLFPDTQTARILGILDDIFRQRLFEELRTKEGITYTPQTASHNSWLTKNWGVFSVQATVPAAKLDKFYAAASRVAADLAAKEVPAEELERARGPIVNHIERAQQTNGYWLSALSGAQSAPQTLELIRSHISAYKAVTAADVQAVAKTYLKPEKSFKLIAAPEGAEIPALR